MPVSDERISRQAAGWCKRAGAKHPRWWNWLRRALDRLILWPVVRPTWTDGGPQAIRSESERLRRLRAAGLPVPVLLAASEAAMFTADAGRPLDEIIRRRPNSIAGLALAMLAAQTLGRIHRAGFCHGRPFFKDIVFDGTQVTFVDWEEEPAEVMPLAAAQARDVFLFFVSAAGVFRGPDTRDRLERIWKAYQATGPTPELLRALRRNCRMLRLATLPLRALPRRWLGRDLAQALRVLHRPRR